MARTFAAKELWALDFGDGVGDTRIGTIFAARTACKLHAFAERRIARELRTSRAFGFVLDSAAFGRLRKEAEL